MNSRQSLAVLAVVLATGSWALLADDVPGGTAEDLAVAADGDPPGPTPAFRYSDAAGRVLFRVDPTPVAPAAGHPRRDGEVPIRISRQAALVAARDGAMDIELPDGTRYPVTYERSENAPGGTWTFIGRVDTTVGDLAAVVTFGSDAVFGLLPTPDGGMMEISTRHGRAFLRPARGIVPPGIDPAKHRDFLRREPARGPGAQASAAGTKAGAAGTRAPRPGPSAAFGQAVDASAAEVTIHILATYTANLRTLRGSANGAKAEFQNLVAIANQAHIDSGSRVRLAIADFAEIDYPAAAGNHEVLYAVTDGDLPDGTDIRALRDAAAADLVAVIRPYAENDTTCGVAWLPGSDLMAYALDDDNGYSVTAVEDCGPLVLAHELGHNLGLMHDRDTVMEQAGGSLQYGAFPFSFGYRQDGPPAFATVMAYDVGQQAWINRFSHPGSTLCEGVACGVAEESDSVRSLNLTADTIARFRDPLQTISIHDARVLEGDDEARTMSFYVRTSSPAPEGGVTFNLAVTGGTATAGVDWQPDPGWSTPTGIPGGYDTALFQVEVLPDALVEGEETILVRLEDVQGLAVHDAEGVGTIQDDDPRVAVSGRLRFPRGIALPSNGDIWVNAEVSGLGGLDDTWSRIGLDGKGRNRGYETLVPQGGNLALSVSLPEPFLAVPGPMVNVRESMAGADVAVQVGLRLSGELRFPGADGYTIAPVILWNPYGDGYGYYVTEGGDWGVWESTYDKVVMRDVPMQLEVRDPPAPYVRQLVEIPPMRGDATWDIRLRKVPSLTIAHATVTEGAAADGFDLLTMTAELSVPAPAGGVAFDIEPGGTAGLDDYTLPGKSFQIAEGATTVPITVVVFGDDVGEPDETLELRVTGIQGGAWSPGPGLVRIVTDEPREVGEGTCAGGTEWPAVRMCQ